jgi:hypothetical protein
MNADNRLNTSPRFRLAWLALLIAVCATPAQAENWRVDLIVFVDNHASGESGSAPQPPTAAGAIDLQDTAALAAAGIRILPDAEFGLQEQWNRLRNARRFQPLIRLAWTQTDPPAERGPRIALRHGEPLAISDPLTYESYLVSPVEGSVALLLGRFLHIDADLRHTTALGGGYSQHALRERRRMRRDELHHLDSPRLGVLARVSRVN